MVDDVEDDKAMGKVQSKEEARDFAEVCVSLCSGDRSTVLGASYAPRTRSVRDPSSD